MHPGTISADLSRHMSAEKISASGAVKIDGEMTLAELLTNAKHRKEVPLQSFGALLVAS